MVVKKYVKEKKIKKDQRNPGKFQVGKLQTST